MQLDDLGALEERRRDLREAHHQDRADGEVGRDKAVALGEEALSLGVIVGAEARRADDRVDAILGEVTQVLARRVDVREIDGHLGLGPQEGLGR